MLKNLHMSKICSTFASQNANHTRKEAFMQAALKQDIYSVNEHTLIDPNWRSQRSYSRKEFMDKLAKRLGKHYGMDDIRNAQ